MRNILSIFCMLAVGTFSFGQTVAMTFGPPANVTSTSFQLPVFIQNTAPQPMTVVAMNIVFGTTMGTVPTSSTVSFTKDPAFNALTFAQSVLGASAGNTSRPRATTTSVLGIGLAIPISNTMPTLVGTLTVTSASMVYPVTLTPWAAGNPQIQLVNYYNGATNSNAITLAAGSITTPGGPVLIAPLPIVISDLSATEKGKTNVINWSTASEINNEAQVVERSLDGINAWGEVGRVKSKNNSSGSTYQIVDKKPALLSYYRIRSIDFDGRQQYSDVVSVARKIKSTSSLNGLYPVPVNHQLTADLTIAGDDELVTTITDVAGKVFQTVKYSLNQGDHKLFIDVSTIPAGSYTLTIAGYSINEVKSFVKQ